MAKQTIRVAFYNMIDTWYKDAVSAAVRNPNHDTNLKRDNLLYTRDYAYKVTDRRAVRRWAKKLEHHGAVSLTQLQLLRGLLVA